MRWLTIGTERGGTVRWRPAELPWCSRDLVITRPESARLTWWLSTGSEVAGRAVRWLAAWAGLAGATVWLAAEARLAGFAEWLATEAGLARAAE
ncbi:hypothetical protein [Nocardia sp. NPDC050718]|uniref:hypothetical protein n=1 Tax=Nocardia sp. NPDC050718 TaxID=3155788 RepID=UPI0033D7B8CD